MTWLAWLIAALAGAFALFTWWRAREVRRLLLLLREDERDLREDAERRVAEARREVDETLADAERDTERAREDARREAEGARAQARDEIAKAQAEAGEARERAERLQRDLGHERDWARQLRGEVLRLHETYGGLAPADDIRTLVLMVAMRLVEADKGMLLTRADDADGLRLVGVRGFDHDPEDSAVAKRFAREVLERDQIVREDDPGSAGDSASPADEEIQNLVAIPIYISEEDFHGVVIAANRDGGFEDVDDDVLLSLGDHAGAVLQNATLQGERRASFLSTVRVLADAIEAKDPFLRGHSEEVSEYVNAVAQRLELEPRRREGLLVGSLLHDIGKIGISERILLKPGRLTPEERSVIELHPRIGYRLVEQVPALREISLAILHHHERFDGAGYPGRLVGEQIPLEARIIGVADAFSAMTAQRPYRDRIGLEDACAELERCAGTQFDPEIVRVFVSAVRERPFTEQDAPSPLDEPELALRKEDGELLGASSAALTDALTLLYGYRYFHESIAAEAGRAELQGTPFAIVLAELRDLAEVNRERGYAGGDEHLRACARALTRVAVRHGATACRPSGSRFALICSGCDDAATISLADELAAELAPLGGAAVAGAAWRPGDSGDDVLTRVRALLDPTSAV